MNLTRTKEKFSVDEEFPGLLKLNVEHTIKESKGEVHYPGPRYRPWHGSRCCHSSNRPTTQRAAKARCACS